MREDAGKAQSIVEYLVVLSAIIVAILIGVGALNTGVSNGLNNIQNVSEKKATWTADQENQAAAAADASVAARQQAWDAEHPVGNNGTQS